MSIYRFYLNFVSTLVPLLQYIAIRTSVESLKIFYTTGDWSNVFLLASTPTEKLFWQLFWQSINVWQPLKHILFVDSAIFSSVSWNISWHFSSPPDTIALAFYYPWLYRPSIHHLLFLSEELICKRHWQQWAIRSYWRATYSYTRRGVVMYWARKEVGRERGEINEKNRQRDRERNER